MTIVMARYSRAGRLDSQFGDRGVVRTDIGVNDRVLAMEIGRDNRLTVVVATSHVIGEQSCDVVRYSQNGDLDTSFGNNGHVSFPFFPGSVNAVLRAAAFDPRPDPIFTMPTTVAAATNEVSPEAASGMPLEAGLSALGGASLDATRLIAAGTVQLDEDLASEHFAVSRFLFPGGGHLSFLPGGPDPSFGDRGRAETYFFSLGSSRATCVGVDRLRRVIVAGWAGPSDVHRTRFAVSRYLQDGSPDRGFARFGKVTNQVVWEPDHGEIDNSSAAALTIRADHRIVVGGVVETPGETRFGLCRYESDGDLDQTFGYDGSAATAISGGVSAESRITALTIDGRGRVVAVGRAGRTAFAVTRYADGRLDNGFNGNGIIVTSFGLPASASAVWPASASAVWIDADTETVTVGGTVGNQFGIARYAEDGSPDRTFGATTGKLRSIVVPEPGRCEAAALAVDSEGGTVMAGHLVED